MKRKLLMTLAIIIVAACVSASWVTYSHNRDKAKQTEVSQQAQARAQVLLNMTPQQIAQLSPDLQKKVKQAQSNERVLKSLKFSTLADYEKLNEITHQPL